ncbi:MAG TPA: WecB/TagA/CpsF family glycosyltransferase, partial [Microbacterium sp.]|nr:WecB/TagA/CpsF family glycosyltransferase [Microbacterium sp.]
MTTTLTVSGSELPVPYPLIVLKPASGRTDLTQGITTLDVDGTPVHLVDRGTALSLIAAAARHTSGRSLGVASINLDHLHHFGASRRERRPARTGARSSAVEWLNLVDGAPIVAHVTRVTGARFPKLSGSDLIESVLDDASLHKQCVAILGGMPDVTSALSARIADKWPGIRYAGHWAPSRQDVDDGPASGRIASELRTVGVDIL